MKPIKNNIIILFFLISQTAINAQSIKKETILCGKDTTQITLFNSNGNITEQYLFLNNTKNDKLIQSFSYNNNKLYETKNYLNNKLISTCTYIYNSKNQLEKKVEKTQTDTSCISIFSYDENNNIIKEKSTYSNQKTIEISFEYDENKLIKRIETIIHNNDTNTSTKEYEYDSDNLLIKETLNNNSYTYEYDEQKMLKSKTLVNGNDTLLTIKISRTKNGLTIKESHIADTYIVREETTSYFSNGHIKNKQITDYRNFTKSAKPIKTSYNHKYEYF